MIRLASPGGKQQTENLKENLIKFNQCIHTKVLGYKKNVEIIPNQHEFLHWYKPKL